MQDIWMQLAAMGAKAPPTPEPVIDSFIRDVKLKLIKSLPVGTSRLLAATKLRASLEGEQMGFPRDKYWEKFSR